MRIRLNYASLGRLLSAIKMGDCFYTGANMGDVLHLDPQTVARRCTQDKPDYSELTPLDWVVLDFTDGIRTFAQMLGTIPTTKERLTEAFVHLRLIGFLTWKKADGASSSIRVGDSQMGNWRSSFGAAQRGGERSNFGTSQIGGRVSLSAQQAESFSAAMPTFSYTDEVCRNYIPERFFSEFRKFSPKLLDAKLDLSLEMQAFVEFIYDNLSQFSSYELLGISEGTRDKAAIRQAYMTRTKQFHPDRYFRKNLGAFAPRIAAIFKAISSAFHSLQT